jgi:CheY-like chemotaxis protein
MKDAVTGAPSQPALRDGWDLPRAEYELRRIRRHMSDTMQIIRKAPAVLCVDDDPSILKLTKMALELAGYRVLTAENGEEALRKFSAKSVNAVVLDYEMPEMNGAEVASAMKRLNPHVPKILFTGLLSAPAEAAPVIEGFCSKTRGVRGLISLLTAIVPLDNAATSVPIASLGVATI